jgi:hypothetical protein
MDRQAYEKMLEQCLEAVGKWRSSMPEFEGNAGKLFFRLYILCATSTPSIIA